MKNNDTIRPGSRRAWFLASRPKTLTGAVAPVLVGGALAWRIAFAPAFIESANLYEAHPNFDIYLQQKAVLFAIPLVCCLLFAIFMQVAANFVNDYYDCIRGTDRSDRIGPQRACQQGWIKPRSMLIATVIAILLASCIGGFLALWNMQWELIAVGIACILFCILYTTHLSYMGLGDLLVVLFFGIVPVFFTYYVITGGQHSTPLFLLALAQGIMTDTLLLVNNYRDRHQDYESGKKTIVVRLAAMFGDSKARTISLTLYWLFGTTAIALAASALSILQCSAAIFLVIPFLMHCHTSLRISHTDGKALNGILTSTARNIFIFGIVTAAILLLR